MTSNGKIFDSAGNEATTGLPWLKYWGLEVELVGLSRPADEVELAFGNSQLMFVIAQQRQSICLRPEYSLVVMVLLARIALHIQCNLPNCPRRRHSHESDSNDRL